MTKFLGILAAVVVGSAMCGAARAGDYCDYPHHYGCGYYDDCHSYCDYYHRDHYDHRAQLAPADCGDFSCRDWLPRRQAYVFWSPKDHSWYYWCTTSHNYLPYDQFDAHPPETNVVPEMPKGLPPVVAGGADRPAVVASGTAKDKDKMPSVAPDDLPSDNVPVPAP